MSIFIANAIGSIATLAANLRYAGRDFIRRHFDFFTHGDTGAFHGLYIKLPGLPFSAFVEWREQNVGWEVEREPGHVKVWAGRLEGSFCREPRATQLGREA